MSKNKRPWWTHSKPSTWQVFLDEYARMPLYVHDMQRQRRITAIYRYGRWLSLDDGRVVRWSTRLLIGPPLAEQQPEDPGKALGVGPGVKANPFEVG